MVRQTYGDTNEEEDCGDADKYGSDETERVRHGGHDKREKLTDRAQSTGKFPELPKWGEWITCLEDSTQEILHSAANVL